jgi:hypothetical protein
MSQDEVPNPFAFYYMSKFQFHLNVISIFVVVDGILVCPRLLMGIILFNEVII